MATAFIQHTSSLIRIGADGAKLGDEWTDPVTVVWISAAEVLLLGFRSDGFSVEKFRAIEQLLSGLGVDKVTWYRVKAGKSRRIDWTVRHDLYRNVEPQ